MLAYIYIYIYTTNEVHSIMILQNCWFGRVYYFVQGRSLSVRRAHYFFHVLGVGARLLAAL